MNDPHIIHDSLTVQARRVPDYSLEDNGAGGVDRVELPGMVQIGVELGGQWVTLYETKAGYFGDEVKQSQPQSSSNAEQPSADPPAQPDVSGDPLAQPPASPAQPAPQG